MKEQIFKGIKVIDAGSWIAGPTAATIMADLGADVIKVEPPEYGDSYRGYVQNIACIPKSEIEYSWEVDTRNKRSLTLNLKSREGHEVLKRLVAGSDVFLTNMPKPARARLRLGYDDIRQYNQKIIYASLTPYGEDGPESNLRGFDMVTWFARSGLMYLLRRNDAFPRRSVPGMGDHATALALFGAILSGLYCREKTGEGRMVSTSLMASGIWTNALSIQAAASGVDFQTYMKYYDDAGHVGDRVFKTEDGCYILLDMFSREDEFNKLLQALNITGSLDDATDPEFGRRMEEAFLRSSSDHLKKQAKEFDIPLCFVSRPQDVLYDEQALINKMLRTVDEEKFPFRYIVNHPICIEGEPEVEICRAPKHGEHTNEILLGLGYSMQDIESFRSGNIV